MRTRVKMCGMTRPADVEQACELGVDAIGIVLFAGSPRCVEAPRARELAAACPPFVDVVALFQDPAKEAVEYALDEISIDYLQFHGDEPEQFCSSFSLPYIKAIPMGDDNGHARMIDAFAASADALLFDSHRRGAGGGTGRRFDWQKIPAAVPMPVILAGGLTPANVGDSIAQVKPFAVDVSSGIETDKGIKDRALMHDFMQAVHCADRSLR